MSHFINKPMIAVIVKAEGEVNQAVNLEPKWFDMTDFESADDVIQAIKSECGEGQIQIESFSGYPSEFNTYDAPENTITLLFDYMETIVNSSFLSQDAVDAGIALNIDLSALEGRYCGQYNSDAEFAKARAVETGAIKDTYGWPCLYIDWDAAAEELMLDFDANDGYYFNR